MKPKQRKCLLCDKLFTNTPKDDYRRCQECREYCEKEVLPGSIIDLVGTEER